MISALRWVLHDRFFSRIANRVRKDGGLSEQEIELLDSANDRLSQATQWVDGILVPMRLTKAQTNTSSTILSASTAILCGARGPRNCSRARRGDRDWVGWDRSLPRLYIDPNQLGRVLITLISNAVAASPRGSRLSLRVAWQTNVTQRLVIAIEDEGPGCLNRCSSLSTQAKR